MVDDLLATDFGLLQLSREASLEFYRAEGPTQAVDVENLLKV